MDVVFGAGCRELTGPIVDGTCVRQSFVAREEKLRSVKVAFATYKRRNEGTLFAEITESNKVLASASVDAADLEDNAFHTFVFNVELDKTRGYELLLRTINCRSGSSVTAKHDRRKQEGHLFNGARIVGGGELSCIFNYSFEESASLKVVEEVPDEPSGDEHDYPGLVSVVIPHYNCHELLAKCLVSLSKQTYSGFEVIVVDDGSRDPAPVSVVVAAHSSALSIKYHRLDFNKGAPVARNTGAKMASGEYIIFIDADCEFYHRSFERYVRALMANPAAAYSYGGFLWGGETVAPRRFDIEVLRKRNYISTMSMLRRGEFVGFDERLKRHQDWDLWLTLGETGRYGTCINELLFETPKRRGSISTDENMPVTKSINLIKSKHKLNIRCKDGPS